MCKTESNSFREWVRIETHGGGEYAGWCQEVDLAGGKFLKLFIYEDYHNNDLDPLVIYFGQHSIFMITVLEKEEALRESKRCIALERRINEAKRAATENDAL